MDYSQQEQTLKRIMNESSELLGASKADITFHPQPCLNLTFKRGESPWLEKEDEIAVFIDIHTIKCVGTEIPHLRFTGYFPYPIAELDDIHLKFLLKTLSDLYREMPFVEIGALQSRERQVCLSFRCNRLFLSIDPVEVVFFVNRVVIAIEYAVPEYEAFLKKMGVGIA